MGINAQRVKSAEYVRNIFSATPDISTRFEDMLKPDYWAHVSHNFQPGSRIEVLAEDSSWFAELIVISCARNWAKMSVLRFVELGESTPDEAPEAAYKIIWRGNIHKHSVVRSSDKQVIKAEFPTAVEARKWLDDYESSIKA